MSEGNEVKKLSRLEREQEKIRIAQANIDRLLAEEKKEQQKQDTHNKVLLGVILQGMIADGTISTELFDAALEKYLTKDKDKKGCKVFVDRYKSKSNQIDSPVTKPIRKKQQQLEEIAKPSSAKLSTVEPPIDKLERSAEVQETKPIEKREQPEEIQEFKPVIKTNDPKLAMFE
jgi:hypothetical protein